MKCRHCSTSLDHVFLDLASSPPSNAYLTADKLSQPEQYFPLRVMVCTNCWLVQTQDTLTPGQLFNSSYAYHSGYSTTWLEHCKEFASEAVHRFQLTDQSSVIEVAANDGSLLQLFRDRGLSTLAVEPTSSTALQARHKNLNVIEEFFSSNLARDIRNRFPPFDLAIANNVLAHIPDINDFVSAFTLVIKPTGVVTFEFPYLGNLCKYNQFDTVYHEHFSYLSLTSLNRILQSAGLSLFDVKHINTHGGSLRVYVQPSGTGIYQSSPNVSSLLQQEIDDGFAGLSYYSSFQSKANQVKYDLLQFLLNTQRSRCNVAAYGAAAKGNTLLNYAGVRRDLISFVVDKNPAKIGKYLPGSHIPIVDVSHLARMKPDYLIILPWNLADEITEQVSFVREWGCKFVVPVPSLKIF